MPTSSAMRWFVGLTLLLSGCMIWDDEVSRATAGGLLSKPIVRATLTRHREWVIIWGHRGAHLARPQAGRRAHSHG